MKAERWQDLLSDAYDARNQGAMTKWLSQRVGRWLAAFAWQKNLHPNHLTYAGLFFSLLGSLVYAVSPGSLSMATAASLLLWQVGFAFDCADGQLARAKKAGSSYGAWLDVFCDFVRQCSVVCALGFYLTDILPTWIVWLMACSLASGLSVYLFTVYSPRDASHANQSKYKQSSLVKKFVVSGLDTPVFLSFLVILQTHPIGLCCYALTYGGLLVLRAWSMGGRKIARDSSMAFV